MKSIILAAALLAAAPAQAQVFNNSVTQGVRTEWADTSTCGSSVRLAPGAAFIDGKCNKVEISTMPDSHNIRFWAGNEAIVFVLPNQLPVNNSGEYTLPATFIALARGNQLQNATEVSRGSCTFVRKGDYSATINKVVAGDLLQCAAGANGRYIINTAGFLQGWEPLRRIFR